MTNIIKTCIKCGLGLNLESFPKAPRNKDGHASYCKSCTKDYNKSYRKNYVRGEDRRNKNRLKVKIIPTEKECIECRVVKPIDHFYKWKSYKDGHFTRCKSCSIKISSRYIKKMLTDPIKKAEHGHKSRTIYKQNGEYRKALYIKNKDKIAESVRNFKSRFPEKYAAYAAMREKRKGLNGHHWSYKPDHHMDVIWLTKKHHGKVHRFITYDQSTFQYRRKDTNELLDTRMKHESYIMKMIETMPD